ncbi:inositol phosphorylceramide synthase [candidate division KSB1 bacterium]|nr:inositol phosphorylceramide synthase [candidate division KSB1 bacterium]
MIIFSFVLGKERAKRFLIDWSPFILGWIGYDMMRGVADSVRGTIHVEGPYWGELFCFGWLFNGKIPAFWFQDLQATMNGPIFQAIEQKLLYPLFGGLVSLDQLAHFQVLAKGSILRSLIDVISANFYAAHFATPLLLGWIIWHTVDDRRLFYRFVYTLTVLNVFALITFMLYPAAPPWYVMKEGFLPPNVTYDYGIFSAGALVNIDNMINANFFTTLWDNFNANLFAAIPSLHGAYPLVIAYVASLRFKRHRKWFYIYPVGTWFATVYLNQHYIIDLIIGASYAFVAYQLANRWLIPKFFDKLVNWNGAHPSA